MNIEQNAQQKEEKLEEWFRNYHKAVVAYSGGVDSTYVLYIANRVLQNQALAISSFSESVPQIQKDYALENVKIIGARHEVVYTEEMKREGYVKNEADRCFYCKDELYSTLGKIAKERGYDVIVDGLNADDLSDYRPGRKAAELHHVLSPLVAVGMNKEEIRVRSRIAGLTTWSIPASACLASRIPHQTIVTVEKLRTVEVGEDFLRKLGFRQLRVRHHEKTVRIELAPEEMKRIWQEDLFDSIVSHFKSLGFQFVTLDLEGYRTGSLNPKP
jgi:pyridinium-3,5-biscarboxylic acid mononucleotide sulfurtransferase